MRGWPGAECRKSGSGLPGTTAKSPLPPPGFRLSARGALHPDTARGSSASPDTRQEPKGAGGTQRGLRSQRGKSKPSPVHWWAEPSQRWWAWRERCLEMTSIGAASPERSTRGRCRAARRGGAGNGVLAAPEEESGRASTRGTQTPLSSSKAAPTQWSWKRNS